LTQQLFGQKHANSPPQLIALFAGFLQRDIHLTMWIGLAGFLVTMLTVVPPWPFYNQNPQAFIGSNRKLPLPPGGIVVGDKKVN
jgi:signal peptidase complex subunit 1